MSYTVLVVDDEPNIVEILEFNLKREGYNVLSALDGKLGLTLALDKSPDLILLDVMLPGINGFEICKEIREKDKLTPILMLTAREEERDKILGLEYGADDYIVKPFSVRELMARVKTNMRRNSAIPVDSSPADDEVLIAGRLMLYSASQSVTKDGVHIELTQREFELLRFMSKSPGKLFSREELMSGVWNYDYVGDARLVDVAIRRLREKLEDAPAEPTILITKRGVGYYIAQ
ncbi:MAG: response regulator transcription factor [Oscillospiraceae bacterium]|jgi:two-component system response regulator VicR|nr:response regulator transcription factor [Oscillospiraceae bacterium]